MTTKNQPEVETAKRQSVSQNFNLSQLESLQLSFTDQQGNEVLVIELDRQTEQSPQLKLSTGFTEGGYLKSQLVIFDIAA